jgi:hypothetical protein
LVDGSEYTESIRSSPSGIFPEELIRNRESMMIQQYIDVYVRQFVDGMDENFINEHVDED